MTDRPVKRTRRRAVVNALNGGYWDVEPQITGISRGTQTMLDGPELEILLLKRDMAAMDAELDRIAAHCEKMTIKLEEVGFELEMVLKGI
jgi:hypothetical protein